MIFEKKNQFLGGFHQSIYAEMKDKDSCTEYVGVLQGNLKGKGWYISIGSQKKKKQNHPAFHYKVSECVVCLTVEMKYWYCLSLSLIVLKPV